MNAITVILGVLMFAVVTAFLYILGLKKSMTEAQDLEKQLLSRSASKVIKYLKKNGYATKKQITSIIKNIKSGFFWSRQKAKINNTEKFTNILVEYMINQKLIQYAGKNGYELKKN